MLSYATISKPLLAGRQTAAALAFASLALCWSAVAQAQTKADEVWWPEVASSMTPQQCQEAIARWTGTSPVLRLPVDQPQAVSVGLVESGLLEALNRAGLKHTLFEQPAERKVSFVVGSNASHAMAFAFVGNHLEAWLWKAHIAPDTDVGGDQNAFIPSRLAPVHRFINEVGRRCRIRATNDKEEGRIRLAGSCGGQRVYVEYFPESDEVWLVFATE